MRRVPALVALVLAASATDAWAAASKKTGSLTINCPVLGAKVFVDGKEEGTIPISPLILPFGKHKVRIVRNGLIDHSGEAVVYPGQDTRFDAAPEKPMALFTVDMNVKGEVLVDGELAGPLPLKEFVVRPGKHTFLVRGADLQPFKDSFMVSPNREFVAKPALKRKDGSPAQPALDLDLDMGFAAAPAAVPDLDLDLPVAPPPAKPGKPAPAVAALDLDLDLDAAPAAPPAKPAPSLDFDLDLDVPAPEPTKPGKPAAVAVAPAKPPPAPPKVADKKPAPDLTPKRPPPVEQVPAFVADPIAKAEIEDEGPSEPIYMNKFLWAGSAVAVVAGIVVPLVWPKYIEERDPGAICPDCVSAGTVLNMAR